MAQQGKPNIVVIFGDDIGMWNVGLYTHGLMGWTPNIDRIGREGVLFTDHFPPSQGADTLSMHKAVEEAMRKLETPHGSSN
jgi:arylsulfatase A-like enzyme